ncbi:REP element-mobilizing transposase RayT [Flavobacteriaceae bacterium MAR_2010_188]|nr:REP element-mobilizing transposase RayT [Flavobacteriaceae bacterium MAR_2010_188]
MLSTDGYKIRDQTKPHFLTLTIVNWIDIFTRQRYRDIIEDSLNFCIDKKGMVVFGYVIMSNHLHLIAQDSRGDLSALLRDFKKFTAKKIIESIRCEPESRREWVLDLLSKATQTHGRNKVYQFWKYGNHPEEIHSEKFMWRKLDYIHLNPVRAGLVVKASDYCYSSAGNYVNGDGNVKVSIIDNPVIDISKPDSLWKSIAW